MLEPKPRASLLRGHLVTALALASNGVLHRMRLVENDHSVKTGAQPFDDLPDARKLLAALVAAQRSVGRKKDTFRELDRRTLPEARQRRNQEPLHAKRGPVALRILDQLVGLADPDRAPAALEPVVEQDAGDLASLQVGAHLYAPIGLPPEYAVVTADTREIHAVGTRTCESKDGAKRRHDEQESIWNAVWRRRAIYFLTVFASLYFALYPLIRESYAYQEMATRLRIVADGIKLLGIFLPSGADR